MYSKHHAAVSLAVATTAVYLLPSVVVSGRTVPSTLLIAYATALGVLIDLDHFLIARIKTGRWDAVGFCLADPVAALVDQRRIFERGDVGALSRLLSHLLIAGVSVGALAFASVPLAVLTALVLYAHLLCDVAWDIVRLRRRAETTIAQVAD